MAKTNENILRPYAAKVSNSDFGALYNLYYTYLQRYNLQPNVKTFIVSIKENTIKKMEKDKNFSKIFLAEKEKFHNEKLKIDITELCFSYKDALVYFNIRTNRLSDYDYDYNYDDEDSDCNSDEKIQEEKFYNLKILYQENSTLLEIEKFVEKEPEKKKKGNVHLLCKLDGALDLQRFDVKLPSEEIDLKLNYGEIAEFKFQKIIEQINNNKNGLVLLSGDPGTGKSTFLKYLTTKTTRKVVYVSSTIVAQFSNPEFLSFILEHRNCILLLEDAEKVLRNREVEDNNYVSNILNISDGILGDCLNILIIATFNIGREDIDPALVRKGRLLIDHHFIALTVEQSNILLEKIGIDHKTDVPMTLAEIYNKEDNYYEKKQDEKIRVGF